MKQVISFLIFFPVFCLAQLPNPHILAKNGVTTVEIWKHNLDPATEGTVTLEMRAEIREIKKRTPNKEHLSTWFFNSTGYPDSCWIFENYLKEKHTYIFGFDEEKRVVFLQENVDNQLKSKNKLERLENGNILYWNWNKNQNDWALSYTLAPDSLLISRGVVSDSTAYYYDDRSTGIIARALFKDGKLAHRYSEKWTTKTDGTPDSLYISFEQFEEIDLSAGHGPSSYLGYKLREDGSVIPGHGNNHYWNRNFYKRGNKTTPFDEKSPYSHPLRNFMYMNEFIETSKIITEMRFSNVNPQYYLKYKYTM